MKRILTLTLALVTLLGRAALAQSWSVEAMDTTRSSAEGQRVRVNLATHLPAEPVRHVIVSPLTSATSLMQPGATKTNAAGPWARGAAALAEGGVALVQLDAPSDAAGRTLSQRPAGDMQADLQAAVDKTAGKFPGVPVHLGMFAVSGATLDAAARVRGVSRIIVASGTFLDDRERSLKHIKQPVLFVHASTAQCDAAPLLEAEQLAHRHGHALVRVGYQELETTPGCGANSQHALRGMESEFAAQVTRWLDGGTPAAEIGSTPAHVAWSEQLLHYDVPGALGTHRLEMTLWLPNTRGPAPVVLFNHGDVELDFPQMRFKRRIREMVIAREFLKLGMAVAMPARRGIALSGGTYPRNFSANDGDPTYKARVHAQDVLPALDLLRSRPDLDGQRIVLAGQSAGGYSATYVAGKQLAGVVGVVDFSGGRTDIKDNSGPGYLNRMMVNGFAELGRAVKVPALFIFAEEDSRYSVQTIRAAHEAFVAAGGRARLVLAPPIGRDGHHVYLMPDHWRAALKEYLAELGLVPARPDETAKEPS